MCSWNRLKKIICILLLGLLLPVNDAFASGNALQVNTKHEKTHLLLYQVTDNKGRLTDSFAESDLDVSRISYELTKKIVSYVQENEIVPDQEVVSQRRIGRFYDLDPGTYLVYSEPYQVDGTWYSITPSTIYLNHSMKINVKHEDEGTDVPSINPPESTDPEKPVKPIEPTEPIEPVEPEEPNPQEEITPDPPEENPGSRLPQTGHNWMAVFGLALCGAGLVGIGCKKKR